MPFSIVHSDITQMRVDAIVNPTDSRFSGSGGVDLAIHQAAGPGLAQECRQLKALRPSEIEVTGGYNLPCKYVLHTVGPVWKGGWANEQALLRSCYLNALFRAAELGAESIAFPLISAGTFGFPKDRVLSVAAEAIRDFLSLRDEDMRVFLCVYDRNAYRVSRRGELERFLNSARMKPPGKTMPMPESRSRRLAMPQAVESAACEEAMSCEASAPQSLEDWLKQGEDLESTVIGTVNTTDPLVGPSTALSLECSRYLRGVSHADILRIRRELLHTTREDLEGLVTMLRTFQDSAVFCAVGNRDAIAFLK